ncbi:MAG: FAD-dependent oxidoreductase [Pseudomonadota bacterium]
MKIAVVGSGIAGMGAALALSERHEVVLLEQAGRFGGHANTVDVETPEGPVPVDTGFIVHNHANYPHLRALFDHLDVPTKASDMSFGLSVQGGRLEYALDTVDTIFAQRRNALRPRFVRMVRDILRFNTAGRAALESDGFRGLSLGAWLAEQGYGTALAEWFVKPMGGAIWSTPADEMLDFPAENFVTFFRNHGLMNGMEPGHRWRTVEGGSREYVRRLIGRLGPRAQIGIGVRQVSRAGGRPLLRMDDGSEAAFDQVVLACHGPEARGLVEDLDPQERAILSAFRTTPNRAILHSDPALMPRRKNVWSSWNFLTDGADGARPAQVTYWMNRLQGIQPEVPLFVSLNPAVEPDPALVHRTFSYAHPGYDHATFRAQGEIDAIQGRGGVWYAGAWLDYGFHEDGLRSGLRVAAAMGATPGWIGEDLVPIQTPMLEAAE